MPTNPISMPTDARVAMLGRQHDRIHAAIAKVRQHPAAPDAVALNQLADALGNRLLSNCALSQPLASSVIDRKFLGPDSARFLAALGMLTERRPLSGFKDCRGLFAHMGVGGADADFARFCLFMMLIAELNLRLQILYGAFLEKHSQTTYAERLALLAQIEAPARRLIAAAEPEKLAAWLMIPSPADGARDILRQLSNFFFRSTRVGFRFTYHCNISCAHCYNFSGPKLKEPALDLDDMEAIVRDIPEAGIDSLNLTGGEPFLYMDKILPLVRAARDNGVRSITIYSNGFWAKSIDNARTILAKLQGAGFMNEAGFGQDSIKISTGAFHGAFIPFQTIANLAHAYFDTFGTKLIVDYEYQTATEDIELKVKALLAKMDITDKVDLHIRQISPIGRAQEIEGPKPKTQPLESFRPCDMIDQIVFDPDGSVRPCCGLNYANDGIVVGDMQQNSLLEIVKEMQNNPILQFLATRPLGEILRVQDKLPKPEGHNSLCGLCLHALGDLVDHAPLKDRLTAGQEFFPFWFARTP